MNQVTNTTTPLPPFGAAIAGQGGYFAAIMRGPTVDGVQQPAIALIVSDAAHHKATAWGEYGVEIKGCSSRTDGHGNTLAMLAANCPAAVHARSITVDGHSDFFVPSIGELNAAAANVPELFDAEGVYWASTQHSARYAFAQDFEYGGSYWSYEDYQRLVCPFRAVPLQNLIA